MKIIPFEDLERTDLIVDAVYEGGGAGYSLGDPISRLLPGCGNLGGFRHSGRGDRKKFVVLFTSGEDKDWPDSLDLNTGKFIYYGDNKTPGHELHETHKGGNRLLRNVFEWTHSNPPKRELVPPFFVFQKYQTSNSARSVQFKGLAVPGFSGATATDDLVAVWKTSNGQRFQNYRAVFTILDVPVIPRVWLDELVTSSIDYQITPKVWMDWKANGNYNPLISEPTTVIRSIESQSPQNAQQERIVTAIYEYFKDEPKRFEAFAAKVFQLHDQRVIIDEITRGAVDGGRDAIGRYLLGLDDDPIYMEFALEAKCYRPPASDRNANSIGVREVARLISRLRHRQFGVLVTTSVVARQAYEEVRGDKHPVVFICGRDIAEILIGKGFNTPEMVARMLRNEFPN
ncbi:MAG: restriction endonuclease [Actinobacteria bacterium]|nr:restriction endonuclease [Actinomycetota bacterium]